MNNIINVTDALKSKNSILVDVRTPKEFTEFHIPGAINIPMMSNEERHQIGIVHKEQGSVAARRQGFRLIAANLPTIVDAFIEISQQGLPIIYCARGGMRSQSISQLLSLVKVKHLLMQGGYKAYRRLVVDTLDQMTDQKIVVLHGLTGVGKTLILHELIELGEPVIDIERLANHRGSAFGSVGLGHQPSQKMFESWLYQEIEKHRDSDYLIVECESRRTGRLNLPNRFFDLMQAGSHILAYASLTDRIDRIKCEYGSQKIDREELASAINRLGSKLGRLKVDYMLEQLQSNKLEPIIEILLVDYYDPLYGYSDQPDDQYQASFDADDITQAARAIQEWCNTHVGNEGV